MQWSDLDRFEELIIKGKKLLEDNKFDEALGSFDQALLLNSKNPELWNYKGVKKYGQVWRSIRMFQ